MERYIISALVITFFFIVFLYLNFKDWYAYNRSGRNLLYKFLFNTTWRKEHVNKTREYCVYTNVHTNISLKFYQDGRVNILHWKYKLKPVEQFALQTMMMHINVYRYVGDEYKVNFIKDFYRKMIVLVGTDRMREKLVQKQSEEMMNFLLNKHTHKMGSFIADYDADRGNFSYFERELITKRYLEMYNDAL